jgi:hypothetical protein
MKTLASAFLFAILLSPCLLAPCRAQDTVTTKDSTEYKGRIVEESPGSYLVIRSTGGELDTIPWDSVGVIRRAPGPGKKSPWLAWGLSFVVFPGLGQFYNGDVGKGIGFTVVGLASMILSISAEDSGDEGLQGLGGTFFFGTWLVSWIDAPIRSSAINRQRGYSLAPSLPSNRREAMLAPAADEAPPLIRLAQVTFHF